MDVGSRKAENDLHAGGTKPSGTHLGVACCADAGVQPHMQFAWPPVCCMCLLLSCPHTAVCVLHTGAPITIADCNTSSQQRWFMDSLNRLRPYSAPSRCLNIVNASTQPVSSAHPVSACAASLHCRKFFLEAGGPLLTCWPLCRVGRQAVAMEPAYVEPASAVRQHSDLPAPSPSLMHVVLPAVPPAAGCCPGAGRLCGPEPTEMDGDRITARSAD